jgi:hypothetical protein
MKIIKKNIQMKGYTFMAIVMVISVIIALAFIELWSYEYRKKVAAKSEVATIVNNVNDTIILSNDRLVNIIVDYQKLDSLRLTDVVYTTTSIDYRLYYNSTSEKYYYVTGGNIKELTVNKYCCTINHGFTNYECTKYGIE